MRLRFRYGHNPRVKIALALVLFAVATRGAVRRTTPRSSAAFAAHSAVAGRAASGEAPLSLDPGGSRGDPTSEPGTIWLGPSLGAALGYGIDRSEQVGRGAVDPSAPPPAPVSIASAGLDRGSGTNTLSSLSPGLRESQGDDAACPSGMVLVDGDYCPVLGQVCLHELGGPVERCAEFARNQVCAGRIQHKRFCIDQYEYPNQPGVKPVVMISWEQAKATCESEGKRLCTDSEWTLACEGEDRLPYPYGYVRNSNACNIDRELPAVNEAAFADPKRAAEEAARLDQRVPSGAMQACTSLFGVHDMTGNVDEWVINEKHFTVPAGDPARPFASGLKGGYWGPVRNRCRPMTTRHNETFRYYQIGFRCCAGAE